MNDRTQPPRSDIEFVKERGSKVRVVTKSEGWLISLLHVCREIALSALRKDIHLKDVLSGDRRAAVESMFPLERKKASQFDFTILSSDLTAATDNIPHDLSRAIWNALCVTWDLPDWIREVGLVGLGPQSLRYPYNALTPEQQRKSQNGWVVTERGILMGQPLSWIILNLCQLWWCSSAIRKTRGVIPALEDQDMPFRLCGDDQISYWPRQTVHFYETLVRRCGLTFSAGKHLSSPRYGIFTEEIFCIKSEWTVLKYILKTKHRKVTVTTDESYQQEFPALPGIEVEPRPSYIIKSEPFY